MAIVGAAAQMMVTSATNNAGSQGDNLQIVEDDINLNNRRMVLNFGEKDDETEGVTSNPDSGNATPSHQQHANHEINVGLGNENRQPLAANNYFQNHRGSDPATNNPNAQIKNKQELLGQ